jgi:hypothetical protein
MAVRRHQAGGGPASSASNTLLPAPRKVRPRGKELRAAEPVSESNTALTAATRVRIPHGTPNLSST